MCKRVNSRVISKWHDRAVVLVAAMFVQHAGVDHCANLLVDVVGTHILQELESLRAL